MKEIKNKFRSPLKFEPLRDAGQSLRQEIQDLVIDKALFPLVLAFVTILIAVLEWNKFYYPQPPSPFIYTAIAFLICTWAGWQVRRTLQKSKSLKLGLSGERAVAQYLARFNQDFRIFHDVPIGDANIDHLMVGPKGIYTIETKTISKPSHGNANITIVGDDIHVMGKPMERNPIIQAKAQANWIKNFLADSQFKANVQPVVVFPGWYVERFDIKAVGVWILEPKALDAFLDKQPDVLNLDQSKAIASALGNYIRSQSQLT
jgi:Nuclease-related domain